MSGDEHMFVAGADRVPPTDDAQRSLSVNAELVTCVLPDFDQVSITLIDESGGLITCAQVGDIAGDLDRLQYGLGEGPCIDSLRAAEIVVVPQLERDERWQHYAASAAELGLRSQVATPLLWHEDNLLGALNMYSTTRADVAPTAPLVARVLAAQIAGAMASFVEVNNLHRALATRTTIGVAIGVLMAQHELTQDAAFEVLRRRSSHTNVKLKDIAAQLVADRSAAGRELPPTAVC